MKLIFKLNSFRDTENLNRILEDLTISCHLIENRYLLFHYRIITVQFIDSRFERKMPTFFRMQIIFYYYLIVVYLILWWMQEPYNFHKSSSNLIIIIIIIIIKSMLENVLVLFFPLRNCMLLIFSNYFVFGLNKHHISILNA